MLQTNVSKAHADSLYCKSDSRGVKSFYLWYLGYRTKDDVTQTDGECAEHLAPDLRIDSVQHEATQYGGWDVS